MQQENKKHKIIERYLNRLQFNDIRIGSLIAQYYALNIMSKMHAKPIFGNILFLFKYILTLLNNKDINPCKTTFLFTKLSNRFHYNALMDPLIFHYLKDATILGDKNSLRDKKYNTKDIEKKVILFEQTNANRKKDTGRILKAFFNVLYLLVKNRKRLRLSYPEVVFFVSNLLVQLRRASFWDYYFSIADPKLSCTVTEYDRFSEAAPMVLAARKHNKTTITMIHGFLEDYSFTPFLSDYIFCWGEGQKSQLLTQCVDPERILITGNPIFDYKVQKDYSGDFSNNAIRICLAISPGFDNKLLIEPFGTALNHIENTHGIIKLHPSLDKADYKWTETVSTKIEVLSSQDITNKELFTNINLLIINESGIANEALAAGVPVAIFVPKSIQNLNNFQNELIHGSSSKLLRDEADLEKLFNNIAANPLAFKMNSIEKNKNYLKNLYDSTGEESVRSMIYQIDHLWNSKKNPVKSLKINPLI